MPSTQSAPASRTSEVEAQPDLPHKGRSELSKREMQAAQYTPESEGPGLSRAPDAAPNEPMGQNTEKNGRTQRQST